MQAIDQQENPVALWDADDKSKSEVIMGEINEGRIENRLVVFDEGLVVLEEDLVVFDENLGRI